MGYIRSSAPIVLAVYIAVMVFGASFLPHSIMAGSGNCVDPMLMHGNCPPSLAAAAVHHLAALHSLSDTPLANPLIWALAALAMLAFVAAASPFLVLQPRIYAIPMPSTARKRPDTQLLGYLSRFVRSPSL